jgi:hypothetical protein
MIKYEMKQPGCCDWGKIRGAVEEIYLYLYFQLMKIFMSEISAKRKLSLKMTEMQFTFALKHT